ncbi:hypothetical protein LINPERHAP1_LOCUS13192, partial [Linum perenne]
IAREVVKEVQVGKLIVPKNSHITIDTISLYKDPKIWGEKHIFSIHKGSLKKLQKPRKTIHQCFCHFG